MEALTAYRSLIEVRCNGIMDSAGSPNLRLVQAGQSMIMDSLAQALSQQTEATANNGRLAVLDFDAAEQHRVSVFNRAADFEAYLSGCNTRATALNRYTSNQWYPASPKKINP